MLPRLGEAARDWLKKHAESNGEDPFFLYVALTSPHTPWLPSERFAGKSGAGLYGDFVMQTDHVVGTILETLEKSGLADETLVIFTNDNGPIWYERDIERFGHRANLHLRGIKGDAWEGGHRVPFIVRWPGRVRAGATSDAPSATPICSLHSPRSSGRRFRKARRRQLQHLAPLSGRAGEGPAAPGDDQRLLARRARHPPGTVEADPALGSGGFSKPSRTEPEPGGPTGQLYNLDDDPREAKNLFQEKPDVVERLSKLLEELKRPRAN